MAVAKVSLKSRYGHKSRRHANSKKDFQHHSRGFTAADPAGVFKIIIKNICIHISKCKNYTYRTTYKEAIYFVHYLLRVPYKNNNKNTKLNENGDDRESAV